MPTDLQLNPAVAGHGSPAATEPADGEERGEPDRDDSPRMGGWKAARGAAAAR